MICLFISIIASSLTLVNANDNFISHNDPLNFIHRNLETATTGSTKSGSTTTKAKSG
jgi:hypothetical protein